MFYRCSTGEDNSYVVGIAQDRSYISNKGLCAFIIDLF